MADCLMNFETSGGPLGCAPAQVTQTLAQQSTWGVLWRSLKGPALKMSLAPSVVLCEACEEACSCLLVFLCAEAMAYMFRAFSTRRHNFDVPDFSAPLWRRLASLIRSDGKRETIPCVLAGMSAQTRQSVSWPFRPSCRRCRVNKWSAKRCRLLAGVIILAGPL